MRRLAMLGLVLAAAGCGGSKAVKAEHPPVKPPDAGFSIKPPVAAPSFLLDDQLGRPAGPQQSRGHWTVVTFLYTNCPDVCPLIANQLGAAQRRNADLRVVAVSVDPRNDTQAARRKFVANHHLGSRFLFVGGTRAALKPVWAKYHIAALPGPQGTVSHSSYEILVDPQGRERVLFDAQVTARAVLHSIATLS